MDQRLAWTSAVHRHALDSVEEVRLNQARQLLGASELD